MKTSRIAFSNQRRMAARRGIPFNFTFEEWVKWWEVSLGPNWFKLRGLRAQDYVMGRIGDVGPYKVGNVICITAAVNSEQRRKFPKRQPNVDKTGKRVYSKLNATKAKKIYEAVGSQNHIARTFGVSARLVRMIKNKQIWQQAINDERST